MEEIIRKTISSSESYEQNIEVCLNEVSGKKSKYYKRIRNLFVKIFKEKESAEVIMLLLRVKLVV